jgi:putative membrane protein insertion efficiency factor
MHRLLSTERSGRDAPGHHCTQTPGYGRIEESHQAANQGGFSAAPAGAAGRMGHCVEPSSSSRYGRLSHSGAGTATPFSHRVAGSIARGGAYALKLLLLGSIRFYQICLSPIIPSSCRYYPSCSAYAYEAVAKWGAWEGTRLAVRRLLRCRPWGGHGYDPVP